MTATLGRSMDVFITKLRKYLPRCAGGHHQHSRGGLQVEVKD